MNRTIRHYSDSPDWCIDCILTPNFSTHPAMSDLPLPPLTLTKEQPTDVGNAFPPPLLFSTLQATHAWCFFFFFFFFFFLFLGHTLSQRQEIRMAEITHSLI